MMIVGYLAMTAGEMGAAQPLPDKCAWMACHFSAAGPGLTNLPAWLPAGSLLILNDRIPMAGHDPARIRDQLARCLEENRCAGLVLDFQRPGSGQVQALAQALPRQLPCPVIVSCLYAPDQGPVLVPPVPPDVAPERWLAPWQGRRIWLELSSQGLELTLTAQGASSAPLPPEAFPKEGLEEPRLFCRYRCRLEQDRAIFHLWRRSQEHRALLARAEELGVVGTLGLYQEFPPSLRL